MKPFIKEHLFLIAAIVLPAALLTAVFFIGYSSKLSVPPPQYDFLYFTDYFNSTGRTGEANGYRMSVRKGTLTLEVRKPENNRSYQPLPRLLRYTAHNDSIQEIRIDYPESTDEWQAVPLPETDNMQLITSYTAPDGYTFKMPEYRGGGISSLFFIRRNRSAPIIFKDGNRIIIPQLGGSQSLYNTAFVGWIKK